MRDEEIVALYWRREEAAIRETEKKYGRYLTKIACQVLSDGEDARESVNAAYLRTRSPQERGVFLRRYYYMDPVGEIAEDLGMSRSGVKSMLYRLRGGLKTHLEQEGFSL